MQLGLLEAVETWSCVPKAVTCKDCHPSPCSLSAQGTFRLIQSSLADIDCYSPSVTGLF